MGTWVGGDFAVRERVSKRRSMFQRKDKACILELKDLWEYRVVISRRRLDMCVRYSTEYGLEGYPQTMLPRNCASRKKSSGLRI